MTLTALIMTSHAGPGIWEHRMGAAQHAALCDAVALLKNLPQVDQIIVAAPAETHFDLTGVRWDADSPAQPFHFGERLAGVIAHYDLDRVLYLGAGSMPLLSAAELNEAISTVVAATQPTLIANNVHSADWAAFSHAARVKPLTARIERDNMLAWVLREEAGFTVSALKPSPGTRLDIDTPFDLRVLALHPRTQPQLRKLLIELSPELNLPQMQKALEVLHTDGSRVTLIGRVSSVVCTLLERETRSWTRVLSEERGMVASYRQASGKVFSLIADHVARVGEEEFIAQLTRVSDVVFWDTRVYMAHHGLWTSDEDRFVSDVGSWQGMRDGQLKALTCAAESAPIPILLGGHNAVSGGLYAMLEAKK